MKYIFACLLVFLLSGNCFATASQVLQPEPGTNKTESAGKKNSCEKKITKTTGTKELSAGNQKMKREPAAENTEFIGPLSWKPALLY